MQHHFNSDFFLANRQRLQAVSEGPIVIAGNGLLQRNSDVTFPFRQDSNFWYLTGINEANCILIMDGQRHYLLVPERAAARATFDGQVDHDQLAASSGITDVIGEAAGWRLLAELVSRSGQLATTLPAPGFIAKHGFYSNPARRRCLTALKKLKPGLKLIDLRPALAELRMIKQPLELSAIERAIAITAEALSAVKASLANYAWEYQIEADITAHFRRQAADHAYAPIVAADQNACTLHYVKNNSRLTSRSLVLIDSGAEYSSYAADITRTYALQPTGRQLEIAQAVIEAQDYALGLLKPGVLLKEYETTMEQFMGQKLKQLGLIKTISRRAVRQYCPHATSHFLGLDVHDVGNYQAGLALGMVLTVEPGIYIPAEKVGLRIEDNVLITDKKAVVLSELLPRELA